jgi:hypothetical protein
MNTIQNSGLDPFTVDPFTRSGPAFARPFTFADAAGPPEGGTPNGTFAGPSTFAEVTVDWTADKTARQAWKRGPVKRVPG